MNRRQMLAGAATTVAAAGAVLGAPVWAEDSGGEGVDGRLAEILERHAQSLRMFGGWGGPVGDRSLEGRVSARQENALRIMELATLDKAALSPAARIDYDTAAFVYDVLDDQLARPGTVDLDLRPSPYVVSQMNGAYYWLPSTIGRAVATADAEGRDAYLETIPALAVGIEQETARILHDGRLGVTPPDFILAATLSQVRGLRDSAPEANALLAPALGLDDGGALGRRATDRFNQLVRPALDRQAEALETLVSRANDNAGVWAQPDGEANYASSVRANTTTSYSPAELHRMGLEWVGELSAEIDHDLKALGLSNGSVGERIAALNVDARFIQPDTDAGRAEVRRQAEVLLANGRRRLPRAFAKVVDAPVEVRRIPLTSEDSSPIAFYNGSQNGGPGAVQLNLKTPSDLPSWRLPTLVHHEGVPGHHTQYAVLDDAGGLSLFRRTVRFSAWTEGWALYAEHMADEIGAYEDDPFGRVGYLQAQLWRAARVVVDTGIHHKRWNREQAISYMVDVVGELRGPTEREVDRYCVYPGQACCFMVGKQQIVASRDAAHAVMGDRYDLRDFNDLVLRSGPLPMEVLDTMVRQWSAA